MTITINDNPDTVIDLPVGDVTPQELESLINNAIDHAKIKLEGNKLVIRTDHKGTLARLSVTGPAILDSPQDPDEGEGNVGNIEAVSAEEINKLLAEADSGVKAFVVPATGLLRLATDATGKDAKLKATETDAQKALGLGTEEVIGSDGLVFNYYVKIGNQWKDANGNDFVVDDDSRWLIQLLTFNLEAEDADGNRLFYENLGFGSDHPRYIGQVLAAVPASKMEQLENPYYFQPEGDSLTAFDLRQAVFDNAEEKSYELTGGNDGAEPTTASILEGAVAYSDALELLSAIGNIAIVAAPGYSSFAPTNYRDIQNLLITHAETMKYCIAVLDTPSQSTLQKAREVRSRIDSSYAAMYFPWVTVTNPLWRPGNDQIPREINVLPSGFIAGIYARTDITRGVWKAPANEIVRGALRFEQEVNRGQQEVLNPEGINCLRFFFGRGYRVWGARTASSDPEWKYVNVRRYFIYLEHSIGRSTQWAVFEPNGPRLWSNITDTVTAFLYNEWRSGALLGATPDKAFFVRCDRSTMTQADLDNGRMICEVGVAAIKPAEFVIFRIGQKTADAE